MEAILWVVGILWVSIILGSSAWAVTVLVDYLTRYRRKP